MVLSTTMHGVPMKKILAAVLLFLIFVATFPSWAEEPTVYIIKQGDTLWGLSERFLKDPYYWPNLWANNPAITNPHFIYPGQKVKIYQDRIEIVPAETPQVAQKPVEIPPLVPPAEVPDTPAAKEPVKEEPAKEMASKPPVQQAPKEAAREVTFTVTGGEGFIMENRIKPYGFIIATSQNRQMVGEDDVVYTDIGRVNGAAVGNRFSIFKRKESVSHPVSN